MQEHQRIDPGPYCDLVFKRVCYSVIFLTIQYDLDMKSVSDCTWMLDLIDDSGVTRVQISSKWRQAANQHFWVLKVSFDVQKGHATLPPPISQGCCPNPTTGLGQNMAPAPVPPPPPVKDR